MDTIYALATGRGKSGVAVIRVSGPDSYTVARALAGSLPGDHRAGLRALRSSGGQHLDDALVICFTQGHSFTGEDVVEFQLHGSPATIAAVMKEIGAQPGLRPAEPGEFTRRALENGRLDLTQVEGLADLIDAETEAQRQQALRVLSGALGAKAGAWRQDLIRAAALLEATIDFADEDVPVDVAPEVLELLAGTMGSMREEVLGAKVSERIREGFEVAIVGPPNIGKSTLLNALAGREAAITSEVAGTTRDVIEVRMDLQGLPVTMLDTAGLRDTDDHVEGLGIARAKSRASDADLRIILVADAQDSPEIEPQEDDIILRGKVDLGAGAGTGKGVSGKTGQGLSDLIARVSTVLSGRAAHSGIAIRERHRIGMERALEALESAQNQIMAGSERAELAAEDMRTAIRAVETIIGRVDVEAVLDEIFASFCLGK